MDVKLLLCFLFGHEFGYSFPVKMIIVSKKNTGSPRFFSVCTRCGSYIRQPFCSLMGKGSDMNGDKDF